MRPHIHVADPGRQVQSCNPGITQVSRLIGLGVFENHRVFLDFPTQLGSQLCRRISLEYSDGEISLPNIMTLKSSPSSVES